MKTNYTMKEATNKEEAIISILDVLEENPLWLNKCTSDLFAVITKLNKLKQSERWLNNLINTDQAIDLFVELKTAYYNFKDNKVWI